MTGNSLNQSIDSAVKKYSSLFKLPSYKRVISLLASVCLIGGVLSTFVQFPSVAGLMNGFVFGFFLFLSNLLLDPIVSVLVLRSDPLYDFRRTSAVSMICLFIWFLFVFIGVGLASAFGLTWWIKLSLVGFFVVMVFRLIVFNATSRANFLRTSIAALLQPFLSLIPFVVLWAESGFPVTLNQLPFVALSVGLSFATSYSFLYVVNGVGKKTLGISSLVFLKAFLLNWVLDLNAPLEEILEKVGEDRTVDVSIIKFASSKPKAAFAVPSVHPGPFKNIGSSLLPSMLKSTLEDELRCKVGVPHGLFGHELDLASETQNRKLINEVVRMSDFACSNEKASPFVTFGDGFATACCQVFGGSLFISFTLAPETTEDFPKELGLFVHEQAEKFGLACSGIVNAHNSLNGKPDMEKAMASLERVAVGCIEKAAGLEQLPFEVGAASIVPKEFTLDNGMGPGGITVIAVKVGHQKVAYVIVDGNNMAPHLREHIQNVLRSSGIDDAEVFTTDTHAVNAVVLNERGYHAVGEALDRERFTEYVRKTALNALDDLARVKVGFQSIQVPGVKVIGEKKLETLCLLIDDSLKQVKRYGIPIFALSGFVLTLLLLLL